MSVPLEIVFFCSMGMNTGLVIAGVAGATALAISAAAIPFVAPALRRVCIPYVPATTEQLANVSRALSLATSSNSNKKGTLIDLGSGDGRVVSYSHFPDFR